MLEGESLHFLRRSSPDSVCVERDSTNWMRRCPQSASWRMSSVAAWALWLCWWGWTSRTRHPKNSLPIALIWNPSRREAVSGKMSGYCKAAVPKWGNLVLPSDSCDPWEWWPLVPVLHHKIVSGALPADVNTISHPCRQSPQWSRPPWCRPAGERERKSIRRCLYEDNDLTLLTSASELISTCAIITGASPRTWKPKFSSSSLYRLQLASWLSSSAAEPEVVLLALGQWQW